MGWLENNGTHPLSCRVLSVKAEERRQTHLRMTLLESGENPTPQPTAPATFKEGWLWVKQRFNWRRTWFKLLQQGDVAVFQESSHPAPSTALLGPASTIKINVLLCTVRQIAVSNDSSKTTSLNNGGFGS
jgi:hypothetical protein